MRATPKNLLLAASLAVIAAAPCFIDVSEAHAQAEAPLTSYPACTNKPTPQDSEAAHSAYLLGKRFFEESDYGSASHNFIDAFKLDCSKPELLLNIARANELLGNRPEAVHALETYLTRSPSMPPDDKVQLQRRIDNLKAAIAASRPVVVAPPVVPVPVATTNNPPPATPLPPPTQPEEHQHTVTPWIVVGVGGAAVVAGAILYFVGAGKASDANTLCGGDSSDCTAPKNSAKSNEAKSDVDSSNTLKPAGSVTFFAGIGIAAGGVLWHFLEPTGPVNKEATKTSFTPILGPGVAGASLAGHF